MKISAVQTDVSLSAPKDNLNRLLSETRNEVSHGSRLIIFPECFLTGYCFETPDEALAVAETTSGKSVQSVSQLCSELDCFVVFGMLEESEGRIFNTAVLVGPEGLVGSYRKIHLPYLGVDRFTTPGDRPFEVFEADGVRIGMLICYDGGFPEASRVLALKGADLIVLPTNWPPGAEYMSEYSINSRAMENGIFFAAVNRIGSERGFSFIGRSRICDPIGATLASADSQDEDVLRVSIDVAKARTKRIVRVPGKHIIDRLADRRPEWYGPICDAHGLTPPGRDHD